MSEVVTTTTAKPAVSTGVIATVEKDFTALKTHLIAVLVTLVLAAGLVTGAVYGVESLIAKHDLATEAKYSATLAAQVAQTQAAQNILVTTQQQLLVMTQQVLAQNTQLQQQKVARDAKTQKQVQADATLSATAAAQRITDQTNAAPGQATVAGNTVILDLPLTRQIVADLDKLSTAQADLIATESQLANETALVAQQTTDIAAQNAVITDLQKQNTTQVAACAAEVTSVKAAARKSKLKIGFFAYVAGVITGVTLHLL